MSALRKIFLLTFFSAFILSFVYLPQKSSLTPLLSDKVNAQSSGNLSEELKKADERLKELKKRQDALNSQIKSEQQSQTTLAQQAKNIDKAIQSNELQIESLELELEKIQLEVQILTEEQNKLQLRLTEVEKSLTETQVELKSSLNLLYKMSLNNTSFLEGDLSFQDSAVSQEKERSAIRLIKANLLEIKKLQEEVAAKKAEIDEKQKAAADLQSQKQAQNDNLTLQQQALKWQRENKQRLLTLSEQKESNLDSEKRANEQRLKEIEQQRASIIASLTNLPPSNTLVKAGQVIGFQGRSGLSCSWYDPALAPTRTNDYCQKYAGLSSSWYYYDPAAFPSKGSHLHFVYTVGGKQVNTNDYVYGSKRDQLAVMPMNPMSLTQGWHDGGAIDLSSYHGAPVYAVRAGFVSYFCSNFPNVPGFPDPLFGAVVHHIGADGKPDGTTSGYWHLQRRGYPCK